MIEILLREIDADGKLAWEGGTSFQGHHVWIYPEYRKAAFEIAGKFLGDKYEKHLRGTDND